MNALDPRALLAAAALGAVALWTLGYVTSATGSRRRDLAIGAAVGVAVQLGVRLAGVS